MKFVQSRNNPLVRSMRALHYNKVRRSKRQFLIEGVRLLEEAVISGCDIDTVLYCPEMTIDTRTLDLLNNLQGKGVTIVATTEAVLSSVSETKSPQGIVATVCFPIMPKPNSIIEGANLMVLGDMIQDPGNTGTIIRTAEAVGAGGVFFTAGSVYPFSGKVIRASMGSLFRLPVIILDDNGQKLCNYCLDNDWQIVFTVPEGGIPWWQVNFKQPTLLVLGNEGSGISHELLDLEGIKASIPLVSPVESLNVAVAGAVVLFETIRQQSCSGGCK
ncbi:MAG TPA: RNA methyltransferase [Firmicutes bacterium]|nr:RNA methyltransferase [Bacillota bacterium]